MKLLQNLFLCISLSLLLGGKEAFGEVYFKGGSPHVKLGEKGILSGVVKYSHEGRPFSSFSGISYGKAGRFEEPQLNQESWEGVKEAKEPGNMCPQINIFAPGDADKEIPEDCLYLNIHVPMNNTGKRGYPVMVWIHGGGFAFGAGHSYGPKYFMDEDVILVTVNYRLGVLGFLSTEDEVSPGNYGLKDQVTALRWIKENIKYFNGDQDKITIFGESAGGASVHYLLLAPPAKGLFHRAISQSGSSLAPWGYEANPRQLAVKMATMLNCPTTASEPASITSEEIVTCLKGKSTVELVKASHGVGESWPIPLLGFFGPTTEPEVGPTSKHNPILTKSPWSIVIDDAAKNNVNNVPVIFGNLPYEGIHMYASSLLESPELLSQFNTDYDKLAPNTFLITKMTTCPKKMKSVTDRIKEFYFGGKEVTKEDSDALINSYSDRMFAHSVYAATIAAAKEGNPVYLYEFNHSPTFSLMRTVMEMSTGKKDSEYSKVVGHADELGLQFDMQDMLPGLKVPELSPEEEELSKNFIRLWTSFAKHGEPKHSWGDSFKWNPISKEELGGKQPLKKLRIQSNPSLVEVPTEFKERMDFWNKLWQDKLLDSSRGCSKGKEEL